MSWLRTRGFRRFCTPVVLLFAGGCATSAASLSFYPAPIFDTRVPRTEPTPPPDPSTLQVVPLPRPVAARTVVVDAGHGGPDPGALGVGPLPEKAVNLSIALRLARLLAASGVDVVTTRSSDRFIPLDGRAEIAERNEADLFVSIHADSNPSSEIRGATVYIARDASLLSRRAAGSIINALVRGGIECRGIRRAGFRVLVGHSRPAVLVECGYLSNAFEAQQLSQPGHQAKVAAAIAEGITSFLSR